MIFLLIKNYIINLNLIKLNKGGKIENEKGKL